MGRNFFLGIPSLLAWNLFHGEGYLGLNTHIFFVTSIFFSSFWNAFRRNHELLIHFQLLKMLLAIVVSVLSFANAYRFQGLYTPAQELSHHPLDALYFSMVTWTTLGYGDFQPTEGARILAATEALLGTIFLPLAIATLLFAISPRDNA